MSKQRPTFLIAEPEPPDGLSSRKLVLETAKFNVLTAHSQSETLSTIEKFPHVDAVVLHVDIGGDSWEDLVKQVRQKLGDVLIIMLSPDRFFRCDGANEIVHSHDPEALLKVLRSRFGDPARS